MERNSGFTVIELIVVIVVIGIVAAVGIFQLSSGADGYRVAMFRERMLQDLRSARAEALARNQSMVLRFTGNAGNGTGTRFYNICFANGVAINNNPYSVDRGVIVRFDNLSPDADGNDQVVFSNRGLITNVVNGGSGRIIISAGSQSKTITLYKETGFINAD